MKYRIERTKEFRKEYKLCKKRGKDVSKIKYVINQLANGNRLDAKYNDHKLQEKYKGYRECHIEPDWLLIYTIEDDKLILTLTNTGTHSDLFE
ncbi:MAG: type II toxin-antitoxin system YafQ family toxin [Bacteroidetes bacterium]|nr:type II toxin-antitoxin system YafQ family toxin [Bacteroidota bacterium]